MAVSLDAQAAIADIAKSLERQSGEGEFLENYMKWSTRVEVAYLMKNILKNEIYVNIGATAGPVAKQNNI